MQFCIAYGAIGILVAVYLERYFSSSENGFSYKKRVYIAATAGGILWPVLALVLFVIFAFETAALYPENRP